MKKTLAIRVEKMARATTTGKASRLGRVEYSSTVTRLVVRVTKMKKAPTGMGMVPGTRTVTATRTVRKATRTRMTKVATTRTIATETRTTRMSATKTRTTRKRTIAMEMRTTRTIATKMRTTRTRTIAT